MPRNKRTEADEVAKLDKSIEFHLAKVRKYREQRAAIIEGMKQKADQLANAADALALAQE